MSDPIAGSDAVAIVVNGKPQAVPFGATVEILLQMLRLERSGIAVALNGRVVRASAHASQPLVAGDSVEIVRAASGG